MKLNESTQEVTFSYEEAVDLSKQGLLDNRLIDYIENELGHKLPKNTLIRVETGKKGLQEELRGENLYAQAIKDTDAIIQSNDVYQKLYYGNNLEESYRRWCKPELFYYLELFTPQALEDIRAAAYPSMISFYEATRVRGEEVYRTPYLSFQDDIDPKGASNLREGRMMLSFYLNNNKQVVYTLSKVLEVYTEKDFKKKSWFEFAFQREKKITKKYVNSMPILKEVYENIKTGEKFYTLTEQLAGETALAQARNRVNNMNWFKTWSGRENNLANLSFEEKVMIVKKGKACITELHRSLLDIEGLSRTPDGCFSKIFDHDR